jgi:ribose/xylose/arabinose/galactoside ABC-type transport system permease subunit
MAVFQRAFFSWNNLRSILMAISIYGIMSCGMLLAMLVGGIDLAMGSTAALTSCIAMYYYNSHGCTAEACVAGILLALLAACVVGIVHGISDAYFKLPTFVVTLATSNLLYGLASALLDNKIHTSCRHKRTLL